MNCSDITEALSCVSNNCRWTRNKKCVPSGAKRIYDQAANSPDLSSSAAFSRKYNLHWWVWLIIIPSIALLITMCCFCKSLRKASKRRKEKNERPLNPVINSAESRPRTQVQLPRVVQVTPAHVIQPSQQFQQPQYVAQPNTLGSPPLPYSAFYYPTRPLPYCNQSVYGAQPTYPQCQHVPYQQIVYPNPLPPPPAAAVLNPQITTQQPIPPQQAQSPLPPNQGGTTNSITFVVPPTMQATLPQIVSDDVNSSLQKSRGQNSQPNELLASSLEEKRKENEELKDRVRWMEETLRRKEEKEEEIIKKLRQ